MAFTDSNWSAVSSSLSQGQINVIPFMGTATVKNSPNLFTYKSPNDNVATISAANYFLPKYASLSIGDIIMGSGTDTTFILEITASSSTTVTVTAFAGGGGSGTVTSISGTNGILASPTTITMSGTLGLNNITAALRNAGPGYLNVVDFGAKCDGTTDDTTSIQATINAAAASNGLITGILIPGLSLISNAILVNQLIGLRIFGNNNITCGLIQSNLSANILTIEQNANGDIASIISDLQFIYQNNGGSIVASSGTAAIKITSTAGYPNSGNIFQNIIIQGAYVGINVNAVHSTVFRSVSIYGELTGTTPPTTSYGFLIQDTIAPDDGDNYMSDCYTQGYGNGIRLENGGGLYINNWKAIGNLNAFNMTLSVGSTSDLFITNCSLEDSTHDCILINTTGFFFANVGISNCEIQMPSAISSSYGGITINGDGGNKLNGLSITGNVFLSTTNQTSPQTAILLNNVNNFTISGNTLNGANSTIPMLSGVEISASCTNGYVERFGGMPTSAAMIAGTSNTNFGVIYGDPQTTGVWCYLYDWQQAQAGFNIGGVSSTTIGPIYFNSQPNGDLPYLTSTPIYVTALPNGMETGVQVSMTNGASLTGLTPNTLYVLVGTLELPGFTNTTPNSQNHGTGSFFSTTCITSLT